MPLKMVLSCPTAEKCGLDILCHCNGKRLREEKNISETLDRVDITKLQRPVAQKEFRLAQPFYDE